MNTTKKLSVVMTDQFMGDISHIDRNQQGRVLMVIRNIVLNPLEVKGDAIKPLVGDMKGLWRYRLGDYRLVYLPDKEENKIFLVEFSPRGEVYK